METVARVLVPLGALISLLPAAPAPAALASGLAIALAVGNPWLAETRKGTPKLLAWSVAGLGAGMNLRAVATAGASGLAYTAVGIAVTLAAGLLLGRLLRATLDATILVSVGTAICGGSAIAAVAPAIGAKAEDVSASLATVFLLNAAGLVLFPAIGRLLGLPEVSFGLWAALAIHDTSSVVGAGMAYGKEALAIATTVKLARALWIVPVAFLAAAWHARRAAGAGDGETKASPKKPWFVLWFLGAAALVALLPALKPAGDVVAFGARRVLVATLFLIGASIPREALRRIGPRPFVLGVALWILAATGSLLAIRVGLVR